MTGERVPMDEEAVAAEAAQVKGAVMKPWMIAVLVSVVVILGIAGVIWLRSRKRKGEEPQALDGAAAAALASAGDEAGAEPAEAAESGVVAESGEAAESAEAGVVASASAEGESAAAETAPEAAAPDLLADAEQISEEEINAGRTAALKKMLEERGKQ